MNSKVRRDTQEDGDKDLLYPIILVRQISLMFGAWGLFVVIFMAMYAELDEVGRYYFGENGKYVTLAFVILMNAGGLGLYWLLNDFIEEVRDGKRCKNTYTFIKAIVLMLATYGLFKYQYQNMHAEESHSFIRAILRIIF